MPQPTNRVEAYERAMLEASGPYVVANVFYRDHDRAAIARRRLAEQWAAEEAREQRVHASTYVPAY